MCKCENTPPPAVRPSYRYSCSANARARPCRVPKPQPGRMAPHPTLPFACPTILIPERRCGIRVRARRRRQPLGPRPPWGVASRLAVLGDRSALWELSRNRCFSTPWSVGVGHRRRSTRRPARTTRSMDCVPPATPCGLTPVRSYDLWRKLGREKLGKAEINRKNLKILGKT